MSKIDRRKRVYLLILVSLFLSSLACRVEAPKIILAETPTLAPTQVVTQVITQVITPTEAPVVPTERPTQTPAPTLTPTFDPLSAPIYYPLPDCAASRLHVGDMAFVSLIGGANAIRTEPDVHDSSNVIHYAKPGSILEIVAGPYCSWGHIMWLVETMDGVRGFTPEGNGYEYWLFPVGP